MKNIKKYLVVLLGVFVLIGCNDFLDTVPEGGTITEDQKSKAVASNPELAAADVAAMNANMIALYGIFGSRAAGGDYDFGYASACLMMDCNAADMTCANVGYNWYSSNADFTDRLYTGARTTYMWSLFYKQIASANIVLASLDPETENPTARGFLGSALTVRAFDYFHLAQLFQFTYKGHETLKCVPIVTEKTSKEEVSNNPRATVEAVYTQILDDLTRAIDYLDGYKRIDKGYVDQSVAYGLRARVNLVMNNYADAAADADKALSLSGAVPYTLAEASTPKLYDAADKNVLWANIISATNDLVISGILNMPSHLCSFFTDGYVSVGAWKKINKPLFDKISANDIRKQWWLNESGQSNMVSDPIYDDWRKTASGDGDFGAYTNVKFGADGGVDGLYNLVPAQDWILMRAEELLLIRAEGLAMSGSEPQAKALLEKFVNENRMVSGSGYSAPSDAAGLQDEIYLQRRIELWGEGFAFFDIMRLKKPVTRIENGVSSYPDAHRFNVPAESPILLWLVPKSEIEANKGITEEDNNEKVAPPKP